MGYNGFQEPTSVAKFLNATVLSFNASIGLGSAAESTLTVDLIEDCNDGDQFLPAIGAKEVGAPVYFPDYAPYNFGFGGVLQSWTENFDSGGKTFKAVITDPRQLLENFSIIVDSYVAQPVQATNYFNAYAYYESSILDGACSNFGRSGSSERGMPMQRIVSALSQASPVIYSPTGYPFYMNYESLSFLNSLPYYYRVAGPGITLLELIQNGADALGYEFYVYSNIANMINVGLIDLKTQPATISNSLQGLKGTATQLNYGQELRNDKTKTMLLGENIHYLTGSDDMTLFFGEEQTLTGTIPVVPHLYASPEGFWINIKTLSMNASLNFPIAGTYHTISEYDIRAAMSSFDLWFMRVRDKDIPGTLNAAVRAKLGDTTDTSAGAVVDQLTGDGVPPGQAVRALADITAQPSKTNTPYNALQADLEAIHGFVSNLGNTYYGKQFFVALKENVCSKNSENFGERIFTAVPTSAGGWVDYGISVLGLSDPDLSLFRETDGRIGAFCRFVQDSTPYTPGDSGEASGGAPSCGETDTC